MWVILAQIDIDNALLGFDNKLFDLYVVSQLTLFNFFKYRFEQDFRI